MPLPAPILTTRRDQVTRLIGEWNDALADSIAAMNLYLDESKDRRRSAIERLRAQAGGGCQKDGPFELENPLRGRWRLRCRSGGLAASITLAPTEPATVQYLEVVALRPGEDLPRPRTCR